MLGWATARRTSTVQPQVMRSGNDGEMPYVDKGLTALLLRADTLVAVLLVVVNVHLGRVL